MEELTRATSRKLAERGDGTGGGDNGDVVLGKVVAQEPCRHSFSGEHPRDESCAGSGVGLHVRQLVELRAGDTR